MIFWFRKAAALLTCSSKTLLNIQPEVSFTESELAFLKVCVTVCESVAEAAAPLFRQNPFRGELVRVLVG